MRHLQRQSTVIYEQLSGDDSSRPPNPPPTAFIIRSPDFFPLAPESLLSSLLSHYDQDHQVSETERRRKAIRSLESVHLLPVFDLQSTAQCLRQISDTLRYMQATPGRGNRSALLILAGLDALAESVVSASNPVSGAAMLSAVLHSVTHLSREFASSLSVLLVNTRGIGGDHIAPLQSSSSSYLPGGHPAPFTSVVGDIETLLFPTLLMRTLDQGIDTHLLIAGTPPTIQVIKDRTGDGTGKWCWA